MINHSQPQQEPQATRPLVEAMQRNDAQTWSYTSEAEGRLHEIPQYGVGTAQAQTVFHQPQAIDTRPVPTSATLSFAFGLLGLFLTPPFVSAIVAIIAGFAARRLIANANGQLSGRRQALAGIIMGFIALAISLLAMVVYVIRWVLDNAPATTTNF